MKVQHCSACNTVLTKTSTGEVCLSCGMMPSYKQLDTHKHISSVVAHPPTRTNTLDVSAPRPNMLSRALVPQIDAEAGVPHQPTPKRSRHAHMDAHKPKKSRTTHHTSAVMHVAVKAMVVVGIFGLVSTVGIFAGGKPATSSNVAQLSPVNVVHTLDESATTRDATRKQDINTITTALSVYHAQNGSYPTGDYGALSTLLLSKPPYLAQLPNDPLNTRNATRNYVYSSDGTHFSLKAQLENSNDAQSQDGYYLVEN